MFELLRRGLSDTNTLGMFNPHEIYLQNSLFFRKKLMIKIFISYSWDSNDHMAWVKELAHSLEERPEFHVVWDGYDLDACVDRNLFMEDAVYNSDYTLIIATKKYKEKADSRAGGVGRETFLNSAKHWDEMEEKKRATSIVALRDKNSMPNYLNGHLYVDFSVDSDYQQRIDELIKIIKKTPRIPRPEKKIEDLELREVNLTKVSEIIGAGSKNRTITISSDDGTDFSGGNRIKFELWETKTPALVHLLPLYNNINISQTLKRAAEILSQKKIKIKTLIILRPRERAKSSISFNSILAEINYPNPENVEIIDVTYKKYIWDYCIDLSFKQVIAPDVIDFYTTQEMSGQDGEVHDSAVAYLSERLTNENGCIPQLVQGSGGIGKTSLCLSLVNSLIKSHSEKYLTFFIKSEDIRKHVEENGFSRNIEGLYDLYELQARYLQQENIFDKKTFELSIVSGNIITVVDGLDEISSIFKEKFNLQNFLSSVQVMRQELGYGRVLLTSRNYDFLLDEGISEFLIEKYDLLGFNLENCRKYLSRRFSIYEIKDKIIDSIISKVETSSLIKHDRIVPFCVDVIATVYEDGIKENESINFEMLLDKTPYPSLNEIVDHIIFSVFHREKTRQKFELTSSEMADLFCYLNQELGDKWRITELKEALTGIYDKKSEDLLECIKKNPFLVHSNGDLIFKYDFLHSYFNTLRILQGFSSGEAGASFSKHLAKVSKDSQEFNDTSRFFSNSKNEFISSARKIVTLLRSELSKQKDSPNGGDSIAFSSSLENILLWTAALGDGKKSVFTQDLRLIYSIGEQGTVDHLYFKGDLPPFDFSNLIISKSRFRNYERFLESNFEGSTFMYTEFSFCHNPGYKSSNFLKANIDKASCQLGDLSESFLMLESSSSDKERFLVEESEKLLRSFYKGSSFRDNNKIHIRFSNRFPGIGQRGFSKLITNGYIEISSEKEVDTFFKIPESFKSSVRRFLNDGYKDKKMKDFLKLAAA